MLILIDNYDSFTYNIVQLLGTAPPNAPANWQAPEMRVIRNNAITVGDLYALHPDRLILSPGPGTPDTAGICLDLLSTIMAKGYTDLPVLGVCLGHQSIGQAFGGQVIRAPQGPMHGKTSPVTHDGRGLFTGIPSPVTVMRYHALVVEREPPNMRVSAQSDDNCIMGLRHRDLPIEGIQFHPESIMTQDGLVMLHNFLRPDYPNLF